MFASTLSEVLLETWRESCVFTVDDAICGGSGSLFSKVLTNQRHRFPFRKWQVGEGMFCGFKYVQNKDTKESMISQTEFAVKVTKVPMSPARKKMRDDPADKAEIHAFRGVSGSISWFVWSNTSRCVLSSVSITADFASTNYRSGLCVKHGGASRSSACRFGSQDRANACSKHDVAVACRRVVEHWRSGWHTGWLHLWCYRQVIGGKDAMLRGHQWPGGPFKMNRTVPSSLGAEAQAMSLALGFVEWATLFLQELIHGQFDLQGAPAVMQERPPVCVTGCKSLYDHLSAVDAARQTVSHRCADHSRVHDEDRLCDTLGTHRTTNWQTVSRKIRERLTNVFVEA